MGLYYGSRKLKLIMCNYRFCVGYWVGFKDGEDGEMRFLFFKEFF